MGVKWDYLELGVWRYPLEPYRQCGKRTTWLATSLEPVADIRNDGGQYKAYISMLLRITRIAILRPFHLQNASTLHATLLIYLWIASASRNSQKIKYAERNSQRSHLLMAV